MILIIASGMDATGLQLPKTLTEFCSRLEHLGYRAPRGQKWTPGTLSRVFKRYGMTAKELYDAYLPQPFAPNYFADSINLSRILAYDCESYNEYGAWKPSNVAKPERGNKVRLRQSINGLPARAILEVDRRNGRMVYANTPVRLNETFALRLSDTDTWVENGNLN